MWPNLRKAKGYLAVATVIVLAAGFGFFAARVFPFLGVVENYVRDIRVATLSPFEPQHEEIVVVAVTEETLASLSYRSPIDRGFLAEVVRAIDAVGVRAIGFDILLDQPTEQVKDEALRDALLQLNAPLVVAWADMLDGLTEPQASFLEAFTDGLTRGYVTLLVDPADGTVRRSFTGKTYEGEVIPSFAIALAQLLGSDAPEESFELVYRRGPNAETPAFRMFPAHSVGVLPKDWLANKVVLIGADLPHDDRHRTPFAVVQGERAGQLSGLTIHAHALAQLLDSKRLPDIGAAGEAAIVLALAILGMVFAAIDISTVSKTGLGLGGLAVLWIGAFAVFKAGGPLVPVVGPSLSLVIAGGLGSAYLGRRERQQKTFIRHTFSRFMSPTVVEQLVKDPRRLRLGGERREVTCLFTDIAGFTAMIERSDPSVVLPLLNQYLDGMCRIVFQHGGTIDKIVGDALHVFFGAPLDQEDHPARAVRCALQMDAFSSDFVTRQQGSGLGFGETRIGVCTGLVVVGNFGGEVFFDYTAHGDAINTAARLESANKHLGTRICVAEATASRCPGIDFRPIGLLMLKGKSQGVTVHEPVAEEGKYLAPIDEYKEAFKWIWDGDLDAHTTFENLSLKFPNDKLVAFHARRLAAGERGVTIVFPET